MDVMLCKMEGTQCKSHQLSPAIFPQLLVQLSAMLLERCQFLLGESRVYAVSNDITADT